MVRLVDSASINPDIIESVRNRKETRAFDLVPCLFLEGLTSLHVLEGYLLLSPRMGEDGVWWDIAAGDLLKLEGRRFDETHDRGVGVGQSQTGRGGSEGTSTRSARLSHFARSPGYSTPIMKFGSVSILFPE